MTPLLLLAALAAGPADGAADDAWRGFLGPGSRSAATAAVPTTFDGAGGTNVAWAAELPGGGFSGPAVAAGRVYVTADSGFNSDVLHVLAFDDATGAKLWDRRFQATGRTGTYEPDMRVATGTPATDGEFVFAQFSSNDVVCLTADGDTLWYRGLTADYPNVSNSLGMSSSPLLATAADGTRTLIVMAENDAESKLFGLDPATGESRWVLDRPNQANWGSPVLLPAGSAFRNDGDLALCQGSYGLQALDPGTGEIVWEWGDGASTVVSPNVALGPDGDGRILVVSDGIAALEPVVGSDAVKVAWQNSRLRPSYASPVVVRSPAGPLVATLTQGGILSVADLATGEEVGKARLSGKYWATPVAVGVGENLRLFCPNSEGEVAVVGFDAEGSPEILAANKLGEDGMWASPAAASGAVYFRSDATLWKIAGSK
ncbi:outer membrane protein assembly factor BamB family protein [Alienimonas californiensis]|uniref:Outer membrane protein assembly factor BamB n=1 Tax=Alienimonas californiensis TaxID=2527989 RepID=A0A517P9R9_9PLAN|nr:PQQ-binding-like beta-propeller repeat protein [Alienimonas californiensis]QDT16108.1 Outer membrane protein assembly factor BamB [Alienimonas californiensis]